MSCKLIGPSCKDWLAHFWQNNMFADTRICCSDGILNAHRIVLTVGSLHFKTLLEETHDEDITTIVMPEFSTEEAKDLLSQFYGFLGKDSKLKNLEKNKTTLFKENKTTDIEEINTSDIKTEVGNMSECENFENDMHIGHSISLIESSSKTSSSKLNQSIKVTSKLNSIYPCINKDHSKIKSEKPKNKISKTLKKPDESSFSNLLRKKGDTWICLIDGCSYQSNNMQYVKLHMNTHQEKRVCDWCGESIAVNHLSRHIKKIHTKTSKTHKCDECDYESIETERLKAHMSKQHGAPRRFQCPTCGDCFHGHRDLSKHKYIKHSDRKRYKCEDCSKEFKHSTTYSNHVKMHKGIRPFQCKICEFSFTRKDKLNEHVNRHTGAKPFKCDKCTLAFGNSGALSVHRKSHNCNIIIESNF